MQAFGLEYRGSEAFAATYRNISLGATIYYTLIFLGG